MEIVKHEVNSAFSRCRKPSEQSAVAFEIWVIFFNLFFSFFTKNIFSPEEWFQPSDVWLLSVWEANAGDSLAHRHRASAEERGRDAGFLTRRCFIQCFYQLN